MVCYVQHSLVYPANRICHIKAQKLSNFQPLQASSIDIFIESGKSRRAEEELEKTLKHEILRSSLLKSNVEYAPTYTTEYRTHKPRTQNSWRRTCVHFRVFAWLLAQQQHQGHQGHKGHPGASRGIQGHSGEMVERHNHTRSCAQVPIYLIKTMLTSLFGCQKPWMNCGCGIVYLPSHSFGEPAKDTLHRCPLVDSSTTQSSL